MFSFCLPWTVVNIIKIRATQGRQKTYKEGDECRNCIIMIRQSATGLLTSAKRPVKPSQRFGMRLTYKRNLRTYIHHGGHSLSRYSHPYPLLPLALSINLAFFACTFTLELFFSFSSHHKLGLLHSEFQFVIDISSASSYTYISNYS